MAKAKTGGLGRGLGFLFGDALINPQPVALDEILKDSNGAEAAPSKGAAKEQAGAEAGPKKAAQKRGEGAPAGGKAEKSADAESRPAKKAGAAKASSSKGKGAKEGRPGGKESKTEGGEADEGAETVVLIELNDIKPNAKQPRKNFSEETLSELAASIKEHGVIQPVLVRPSGEGYELVAGERRWRAARKAGLKAIPAIVRELDDKQNLFIALIENMQREDLNPLEEARAIRSIMDGWGLTQEQAAEAVGKSRPYVANALRLLKLPEEVQQLVAEQKLSAGHARAIAGLSGAALQKEAAKKAVEEGWSVRRLENYQSEKKRKTRKEAEKSREILAVEEQLRERTGTRVTISGSEQRGSIRLEYYSREELDGLLDLLLSESSAGEL